MNAGFRAHGNLGCCADVVISKGCVDTCTYLPDIRYADWEVTDPAGCGIDVVREVHDEIKARIEILVGELFTAA